MGFGEWVWDLGCVMNCIFTVFNDYIHIQCILFHLCIFMYNNKTFHIKKKKNSSLTDCYRIINNA